MPEVLRINSVVLAREGAWIPELRCAAAFDGGDHGSDLCLEISGRCETGKAKDDGNDRWWGMM
jgi:hypothetical protein